jgi:hypothetical protein
VLRGIHGKIDFDIQDYEDAAGQRTNYLALSGQFTDHQDSVGLQTLVCKYANRLSYGQLAELLEDMTGSGLMSRSHACQLVESSANKVLVWQEAQRVGQQLSIPFLDKVDIYDGKQAEWLLMEDAIGVKKQKQRRVVGYVKSDKTVQIDVMVAQNGLSRDEFSTFVAGKDCRNRLDTQLLCHLSKHTTSGQFPLVVIADGARSIRKKFTDLFGASLIFILDWFHLSEKIWQYMSQIAANKEQKERQAKTVLELLWRGQAQQAIAYVQTQITAKNAAKRDELVAYLTKHSREIINYEKRKMAGKKIGSGSVEKANDVIVAHRQKKKGMAWSSTGSESLAILKALESNGQWLQFWQRVA